MELGSLDANGGLEKIKQLEAALDELLRKAQRSGEDENKKIKNRRP